MTHHAALLDTIGALLEDANQDELEIVCAFVAKMMGEGRTEYGPLDLSTDRDFLKDAIDERLDSDFYKLAWKLQQAKRVADGEIVDGWGMGL